MTLGRAAENFKEYPGVYAALGQVWLEAAEDRGDPSDLRKALEALEPVAMQSTASSETLGMYGRALVLAGRHAEAETIFRQASQRFPTDPEVLPQFASVAQRLGHLDEARQALVKYSVLVDEDRDEAVRAARIADLSMQLTTPPRRSRGIRNRMRCGRATRRCSRAWPTHSHVRGSSSPRSRLSSAQSRKTRAIRSCAPLRAVFRPDSASGRARREVRLREN